MNLSTIHSINKVPYMAPKKIRNTVKLDAMEIRRTKVLEIIERNVEIRCLDIHEKLHVSHMTIKNDINVLVAMGLVLKMYRGSKGLFVRLAG